MLNGLKSCAELRAEPLRASSAKMCMVRVSIPLPEAAQLAARARTEAANGLDYIVKDRPLAGADREISTEDALRTRIL